MSIDTVHIDWIRERVEGLDVAIQVEETIMGEFQSAMEEYTSAPGRQVSAEKPRKARVWVDARRLRDELFREQQALMAVLGELRVVK